MKKKSKKSSAKKPLTKKSAAALSKKTAKMIKGKAKPAVKKKKSVSSPKPIGKKKPVKRKVGAPPELAAPYGQPEVSIGGVPLKEHVASVTIPADAYANIGKRLDDQSEEE